MSAASSTKALDAVKDNPADLVLCSHHLKDDEIKLLETMRIRYPEMIRFLQGDLNYDEVLLAINKAAIFQFVPSEWAPQQVELLIRRALENRELAYRHINHEHLSCAGFGYALKASSLGLCHAFPTDLSRIKPCSRREVSFEFNGPADRPQPSFSRCS